MVTPYNGVPQTVATNNFDAASRMGTISDGTNSATYSFLANSPLVSQINFTNAGSWRMTTTKTYDYLDRLTQIASTPSASPVISFAYAYNNANQRTAVTNADGSHWLYGYDALGQVTSGVKYFANGTPVPGEQFGYAFDNIGNRTSTTEGGDQYGNNLRTSTDGANLNNQYTNRTVSGAMDILGSAVTNATVTVNNQPTYRNGTFYEATLALANTSAAVWQTITNLAVAHSSSTTDLVATVTGNTFLQQTPESFSYDSDGKLSQDGRWTYTWDGENRLIQMVSLTNALTGSQLRLTFGYDSKWRRISKAVEAYNGTTWTTNLAESFVYDGWNLLDELNATNNAVIRSYLWGLDLSETLQGAGGVGGLIEMNDVAGGSGGHFAGSDGRGSIASLLGAVAGTNTAVYEFNAFGVILRSDGPMANVNPIYFASKYHELESNLSYYGFRHYDPQNAKWLSRDPQGERAGPNVYCIAFNDPIRFYDALGLDVLVAQAGTEHGTVIHSNYNPMTVLGLPGCCCSKQVIGVIQPQFAFAKAITTNSIGDGITDELKQRQNLSSKNVWILQQFISVGCGLIVDFIPNSKAANCCTNIYWRQRRLETTYLGFGLPKLVWDQNGGGDGFGDFAGQVTFGNRDEQYVLELLCNGQTLTTISWTLKIRGDRKNLTVTLENPFMPK